VLSGNRDSFLPYLNEWQLHSDLGTCTRERVQALPLAFKGRGRFLEGEIAAGQVSTFRLEVGVMTKEAVNETGRVLGMLGELFPAISSVYCVAVDGRNSGDLDIKGHNNDDLISVSSPPCLLILIPP